MRSSEAACQNGAVGREPGARITGEAGERLSKWNQTDAPFPQDKCVHQLFEEQAARTPGAIAAVFEDEALTYLELDRRADSLARELRRRGVGPSSLVPLCLERSLEMIVAILGTLKAGGAYVPMEPGYPDERLALLIQDTGAAVLITQSRFALRMGKLAGKTARVLQADRLPSVADNDAGGVDPLVLTVSPTDPAYVIYTSGTTGRPKGVVLEHRALCNRIVWMQEAYHLGETDRVLQKTPYTFDVSGWEFFWPLVAGARIVFARPEGHKDPHYLREVIRSRQITVLHFVPSMLRAFLHAGGARDCGSLTKVICSGEALPVSVKNLFFESFTRQELHNLYGPTEAAIDVTAFQCQKADLVVPIGKPIANTRIYILDPGLNQVPPGEAGELYIAGVCLARGYLNQPGLTDEKFIDNPFEPGSKMYRSGDSARWLEDGNIEYLGRTDHQIKIRGNRVELGEIEAAINSQEGVSACAVVTTGGENEDLKLAAYVVPEPFLAVGVHHRLQMARDERLEGLAMRALPNGIEIAELNALETDFLYREIFENQAYLRHGISVADGDCILDAGANVGMFAISLLIRHEGLQIHAFEPIPETARVLSANAALFGGAIHVHPCGLSDAAGQADFTFYPRLSMISGGECDAAEDKEVVRSALLRSQGETLRSTSAANIETLVGNSLQARTVRCGLRTISDVIRESRLDVIHLLKVDVEKMELRVLRGVADADWAKIQQVALEVHDTGGRLREIEALLENKGFLVASDQDEILGSHRIFQVYARKPGLEHRPAARSGSTNRWRGTTEYVRQIREGLRARLPDYMEPSVIVPVDQLPLTANGKIDRKALSNREIKGTGKKRRSLPRPAIEERLTAIWEELLGTVDIGAEDGFFEVGGNSLLAVRAADRISQEFNCHYTVAALLQHARIREISGFLASLQEPPRPSRARGSRAPETAGPPPLSGVEAMEAVLNRHPSIRRSAVVNRRDASGRETLVAFAIPDERFFAERSAAEPLTERHEQWISVWERNYEPILGGAPSSEERINPIGYVRSDSAARIPDEEIRECIDLAVRQVMDHQPKCILEIGCGTGMLLFQFAPRVEKYLATDLSQNAIDHIHASLRDKPCADRVKCFRCDAATLEDVPVELADTVVIHSVAQYFPGIHYLSSVIGALVRRLPPKARIFIGDVRDLRLLRAFHVWTLQAQCPPTTTKRRFRRLLADRMKLEKELVIHPAYFRQLANKFPRVRHATITPKQGRFQNEFTKFRFDVFLHLDEPPSEGARPAVGPWPASDPSLEAWAERDSSGLVFPALITDLPNRRVWKERAVLEWLGTPGDEAPISEILDRVASQPDQGQDPYECLRWAADSGLAASLHSEHTLDDGRFEIYLQANDQPAGGLPAAFAKDFREIPPHGVANHPSFALDWEKHVPVLRKALQDALPGIEPPAKFLFVAELPLLGNNEIDRDELAGKRKPLTSAPLPVPAASAAPAYYEQSLAIVGISCALPGARNHEEFWRNLSEGVESSRFYSESELRELGVPEERIRNPRFVPMRMAFEGRAGFDPGFFNLSARHAENMDPQARLLLLHAWRAVEDAGYAPGSIADTAVFMSAGNNYYQHALGLRGRELQGLDGHDAGLFGQPGMIPAWISYHLGLKGPSMFVQSLCCSSMMGLHLACRSLLAGEAACALVGAASLFAPDRIGYVHEPDLNLSRDGRCRSFDAAADGMVEGEGVCVVLLKRATDAIRDRDHIYALLRGVGVGNDGADKVGFNAPSLRGQSKAVRNALQQTGVAPESIRYVEAHANGTPLGDSIEVAALTEAYRSGTGKKQWCGLGSTKPNIGNIDTVTGLIGCVKAALSLSKRSFPAVVNFKNPNPGLGLDDSPFYVVREVESWEPGEAPLRIAQHVYSLGGMNAHAIYESAPEPVRQEFPMPQGPTLVPLSARTEERLRVGASRLLSFLEAMPRPDSRRLLEIAHTLQTGREAMEHRVIFLVHSIGELAGKLRDFVEAGRNGDGVFQGQAGRSKDLLQIIGDERDQEAFARQRQAEGRWENVAHLWIRGAAVDWRGMCQGDPPHRVSLPPYPFLETEYWLAGSPIPEQGGTPTVDQKERPAQEAARSGPPLEQARQLLRDTLAEMLATRGEALDPERPFNELGVDSVSLIRLTNRLNSDQGWNLNPANLFEHSTINLLASHLSVAFSPVTMPAVSKTPPPAAPLSPAPGGIRKGENSRPAGRQDPIAIVGMSGRFPQAANLEEFWKNLSEGRDSVTEVPADRWSWQDFYGDPAEDPSKTKIKWGGFMGGVAEFDPLFFNIAPREAEAMDPQNRLLMTHVWLAMEDAGYSSASLSGTNTGLFIGTGDTGYARLVANNKNAPDYGLLGIAPFSGPNRVSYFLNLHGPSEPVNTGCSSSLVAVHKAVRALQSGECDFVFAGGVNTVPTPEGHVSFNKVGLLSEDGRCKTFSSEANGFVRGEGVGILALKRLRDAEAAGDHIHGLILGTAENHGGRANSYTAPNPAAQARLIETAWAAAGTTPQTIGYIEAHGTGTKLGDPVEVEGLRKAFRAPEGSPLTQPPPACGLGSVKSNIGHLEFAAGVAGLIKVVLQLQHKTLVKSLHAETLNPLLRLEETLFYVVRETSPWLATKDAEGRDLPRRAGVSSFGAGGVNAHAVLEEYIPRPAPVKQGGQEPGPIVIVLSAKTPSALRERASQLLELLDQHPAPSQSELRNLAHTLQVGRDAMEERLGFVIDGLDSLRTRLRAFLAGTDGVGASFRGSVRPGTSGPTRDAGALSRTKDFNALLSFWVEGGAVDWSQFHKKLKPSRVSLPGYPFARERYWASPPPPPAAVSKAGPTLEAGAREPGDGWLPSPWPETLDWTARLREHSGQRLALVHEDSRDIDGLSGLLEQMSEAAGLTRPIQIEPVAAAALASEGFKSPPAAVLVLGGGTDLSEVRRALDRSGAPRARTLCLRAADCDSVCNQRKHPVGNWTFVQTDSERASDRHQHLIREWLLDGAGAHPARGGLSVRYNDGRRYSRAASPPPATYFLTKAWREEGLPPSRPPGPQKATIVLVNEDSLKLARRLDLPGMVVVGSHRLDPGATDFTVDFRDPESAARIIPELTSLAGGFGRIMDLADLHREPRAHDESKLGKIALYQALVGSFSERRILHVTGGLQSLGAGRMSLAGARFAGLVKMLGAEYARIEARTIDVDDRAFTEPEWLAGVIESEFDCAGRETEICYRDGRRFVPHLVPENVSDQKNQQIFAVDPAGVYVITGGTGGIGLEIAKHLVSLGVRRLAILGIQPLPPKASWEGAVRDDNTPAAMRAKLGALLELDRSLKRLHIHTGPLTNKLEMESFFNRLREESGPIRGIVHSAGVYSDANSSAFVTRDLDEMRRVFEPKMDGLDVLHELSRADDLDFLVAFSSLTGLIPDLARGLGDYAAANAYADYFASYQSHLKARTVCRTITWVDWNDVGHAARLQPEQKRRLELMLNEIGLAAFPAREGCRLFDLAMGVAGRSWVLPCHLDMEVFETVRPRLLFCSKRSKESTPRANGFDSSFLNHLDRRLTDWERELGAAGSLNPDTLTNVIPVDEIKRLDPGRVERIHRLLFPDSRVPRRQFAENGNPLAGLIRRNLFEVLKIQKLGDDEPFQNYGLDSISAMVFSNRLEKELKRPVPPGWLIDHPTIDSLARHLEAVDGAGRANRK